MKLQTTVLALTCAVAALSASAAAAAQVGPDPTAPDIRQTDPRAAGPVLYDDACKCWAGVPTVATRQGKTVVRNPTAPDIRQTDPRAAGPAPTVAALQGDTVFDWGDWGIGAASGIGLTLLTLGGISIIVRRRTDRAPAGPAAGVGP
jgi:hypothetical protein